MNDLSTSNGFVELTNDESEMINGGDGWIWAAAVAFVKLVVDTAVTSFNAGRQFVRDFRD